jgi:hypothetical protein
MLFRLVARYREDPRTSTLLLKTPGRKSGSRVLDKRQEEIIHSNIERDADCTRSHHQFPAVRVQRTARGARALPRFLHLSDSQPGQNLLPINGKRHRCTDTLKGAFHLVDAVANPTLRSPVVAPKNASPASFAMVRATSVFPVPGGP